jgi:hypothetical protein
MIKKEFIIQFNGIEYETEDDLIEAMEREYYNEYSDEIPANESGWWVDALEFDVEIIDADTMESIGDGIDMCDIIGWCL